MIPEITVHIFCLFFQCMLSIFAKGDDPDLLREILHLEAPIEEYVNHLKWEKNSIKNSQEFRVMKIFSCDTMYFYTPDQMN